MLASFVLDPGRRSHAIDTLCLEHLGRTMQTYPDLTGKGKSEIPFAEVAVPAGRQLLRYRQCHRASAARFFAPMLRETALEPLLQTIEMPLLEVLVDMEWDGITIDLALFRKLGEELGGDLRRLEQEIALAAGTEVNLNSPRQLASVLFEKQQLPVLKKTKTGPSTDADVLEQLAAMGHELPRLILEYRELQKLKSTYVDTLPTRINRNTGRIHTSFNQAGAATGRLSSASLICRTFRCAPRGGRPSGRALSPVRAGSSWWRTTPRSSFASWPTSPAIPRSSRPFAREATSTGRPRR